MKAKKIVEYISKNSMCDLFTSMYGEVVGSKARYIKLVKSYMKNFHIDDSGDTELYLFSAPGRTEMGGNHTDHQHGRVLAGAVNLDVIACVSLNNENTIRVLSEGHRICEVSLDELEPKESEKNSSPSLLRGIVSSFTKLGYNVKGFNAYTTSNVLCGSGLSSSAAFEVLLTTIINNLFCHSSLSAVKLAQISQYAENVYFGKPCGLMDQTACAVGGIVSIDFNNPSEPIVENINFNFEKHGYKLVITNTGANHSDLTDDYADIPAEMKRVAAFFGKDVLRDVDESQVLAKIPDLRDAVGDRAILRAMHFFADNARVPLQVQALKDDNIGEYFRLVNESGFSSATLLQNIYSPSNTSEQSVSIALSLAKRLIGSSGACRIHGGGFAGTIQTYVRIGDLTSYVEQMNAVLGKGSCYVLNTRGVGGTRLI